MQELRYIHKYFIKYKYRMLAGVVISILARFLAIKIPKVIKDSIDVADEYNKGNITEIDSVKETLLEYILLIVGLAFLSGILMFLMRQTIIVTSRLIEFDLKNEIFQQYQRLSQSFYKQNRTGDLMNRISEDVSKVRMYFGPAVMYTINMLTLLSIAIWNMLLIDTTLTLYTLIPLPLLSFIVFKLNSTVHKKNTIVQEQLSTLTTFAQEVFSGINVIKSYGIESQTIKDFTTISEQSKQKNINLHKVKSFFFPSMVLLIGLSSLMVIYVGGLQYSKGIITIGTIAEFVMYVNLLTWPVAIVGWVTATTQEAESCQKRINEFLRQSPEIVGGKVAHIKDFKGDIAFENVSLVYPDTNVKALENIDLKIKSGSTVAILGKTGSGKTSLVELISRMYDCTKGVIKIDRIDIKEFTLSYLRGLMGVVPQNSFLFSDTIENNILFGIEKASKEKMIKAAKMANIHQNIQKFQRKYQTVLGERGITISGGQKQRIAIARALLKNSRILILDDCFSAVDTHTQTNILKNLKPFKKQKTVLMVTNRISVSKNADDIVVLEKGKILQQGTHNHLINTEGYYKELYLKQGK